jgi:hypothetical protein
MAGIDLKEYAKRGAEVRLQELLAELTNIYKAFPDLRRRSAMGPERGSEVGNGRIIASGPGRGPEGGNGRSRKRMSAAARKAVSIRMKKYWAQRRKAKQA